jgi:hypothetical protein
MIIISSYVITDAENDHPPGAPDSPVLILSHRNKVQGLYRVLNGSRCDDAFSLKNDKHHRIRFRVRRDLLPIFKAYEDDIGTCGFDQVCFDRALMRTFHCFQEIHYYVTILRRSSILRSITSNRIFCIVFISG